MTHISPSRRCPRAADIINPATLSQVISSWLPASSSARQLFAKMSELLQIKLVRAIETFDPAAPANELNSTAYLAIQAIFKDTVQEGRSILSGLQQVAPFLAGSAPLQKTGNLSADLATLQAASVDRSSISNLNSALNYISSVGHSVFQASFNFWRRLFEQEPLLVGQLNDFLFPQYFQNLTASMFTSGFDGLVWETYGVPPDEASCLRRGVAAVRLALSTYPSIQNTSAFFGIPIFPSGLEQHLLQRCRILYLGRSRSSSSFRQSTLFNSPPIVLNSSPLVEAFGFLQIADGTARTATVYNATSKSVVTPRRPAAGAIAVAEASVVAQVVSRKSSAQRDLLPAFCSPGFSSNFTLSLNSYTCVECPPGTWCPGSTKLVATSTDDAAVRNLCFNGPQTSPTSIVYTNTSIANSSCPFVCSDNKMYYSASDNLCVDVPPGSTRRHLGVGSDPAAYSSCPAPLPANSYEWSTECSYNSVYTAVFRGGNISVASLRNGFDFILSFKPTNRLSLSLGKTLIQFGSVFEAKLTETDLASSRWTLLLLESRGGLPVQSSYSFYDAALGNTFVEIAIALVPTANNSMLLSVSRHDNGSVRTILTTETAPPFTEGSQDSSVRLGDELELVAFSLTTGDSSSPRDRSLELLLPPSAWFDSTFPLTTTSLEPSGSIPFTATGILASPCVPTVSVKFINITLSGENIPAIFPRWIDGPQMPTSATLSKCKLQTPTFVWIEIPCPPWPDYLLIEGIGVSFEYASAFSLSSPLPFSFQLKSARGSQVPWTVSVRNFPGDLLLSGAIGAHQQGRTLNVALPSTLSGSRCTPCPPSSIFSFESFGGCVCEAGFELLAQNQSCVAMGRKPELPAPGAPPTVSVVGINSTVYNDPLGSIEIVVPAVARSGNLPADVVLIVRAFFDQGLPTSQFGISGSVQLPVVLFVDRQFAMLDRVEMFWFSPSYSSSQTTFFVSIGEPGVLSAYPILSPGPGVFYEPINIFLTASTQESRATYFAVSIDGQPAQPISKPIGLGRNATLSVFMAGSSGERSRRIDATYIFLQRATAEAPRSESQISANEFVCNAGCIAGIAVAFAVGAAGVVVLAILLERRKPNE